MSKAMDALDLIRDFMASTPPPSGRPAIDLINAAALLRDYITTTEAAGLVSGDVETLLDEIRKEAYTAAEFERFSSHEILAAIEKRHDTNVALLAAFIAKQEAASAARIKELEEAIDLSWETVDEALGEWGTVDALYCPESVQPLKKLQVYLSFKAALGSAREVGEPHADQS